MKLFSKIASAIVGIAMAIGVGVAVSSVDAKSVRASDSGLTPSSGQFIIDFYDSEKLTSTSGTNLTSSNYSNFVKVTSGLTSTDVVTGVSVTGTVQYGKNGGLTAGTSSATGDSSHYVTFTTGNDYAVTKCTVYATEYESGRWKLNGNAADSGSLGSKGVTFATVTNPLVWDNLGGINTLTFKKDNGSGGTQKRLTIYTIVCDYSSGSFGTLDHIKVSTPATKTVFSVGETFSSAGLVLTGYDAADESSAHTQTYNSGFTTDYDNHTFVAGDIGTAKAVTVTYSSKTTTYNIDVEEVADVVLSKDNNPFTSTSGSNTNTETKTLSGIEYENYGGYLYSSTYLSINKSINGYIGNKTPYGKNIKKIIVDYNSGGTSYFTMYEGGSTLPETITVNPSTTGTGRITYTFSDSNPYFKFKLTTTNTYCNINSVSIFLGSTGDVVNSIALSGSMSKTTYTQGEAWDPTGFTVNAYYQSAPSTPVDVTSLVGWSYNPETTASTSTTSVICTASFGGQTATSSAQAVTINEAQNLGGLTEGRFFLIVGGHVLKAGTFANKGADPFTTDSDDTSALSENDAWYFASAGSSNAWYIRESAETNASYLYSINHNNGLVSGSTEDYWTVEEGTGDDAEKLFISDNAQSRYLGYTSNSGSNIRTYLASSWSYVSEVSFVKYAPSTKLATPVPIFDNNLKQVSWDAIPNAGSYQVKVDSGSYATATSPFDVSGLTEDVQHTVYVKAIASAGYEDSDEGSVTFTPTTPKVVDHVNLATSDGETSYDAGGASSYDVSFTTSVSYDGAAGTGEVNISVTPSTGVTIGTITEGEFDVTFTASDTYTIRSESVEDSTKYKEIEVTISNIVNPGYDLITSTGSLRNGAQLFIYSFAKQRIMGNTAASKLRQGIDLTVAEGSESFIPSSVIPANTEIITLVSSGSHWELKTSNNKYLSLTADDNALYVSDNPDTAENTTEWDISFNGNNALIQSVAYNARYIESNNTNSNFGCYKGTQSKVQLYALHSETPYFSISQTSAYIGPRGTQTLTLTAHNGASDTVTWSTSDASVASIPASSTGTSVVVTGIAPGTATITATFAHPETYEPLVCEIEVLDLQPYVNVGVTTFTKTSAKPTGGWEGTYLIGDSEGKTIFNGSLSPLPSGGENYATLESLPDEVSATNDMIAKSFTIKATETEGVYTIRSNSYYYIGNTKTENGMDTSIKEAYEVSISDSGVMTMNGTTLSYNVGTAYRFFKNTSETVRAASLWRADGEIREITSTLAAWYDEARDYLTCNASGEGSIIDWGSLKASIDDYELDSTDLYTLQYMAAKSAEDNGNYLEDFMSDYDYCVAYKGKEDFLHRNPSASRVINDNGGAIDSTTSIVVISVIALTSISAIAVLLVIKRRKTY